jgi:hypothetical protein
MVLILVIVSRLGILAIGAFVVIVLAIVEIFEIHGHPSRCISTPMKQGRSVRGLIMTMNSTAVLVVARGMTRTVHFGSIRRLVGEWTLGSRRLLYHGSQ